MNILRFLICSGRLGGPQRISTRQMTVADALFGCYSYVCQDKDEFDKLSKDYVAKQNKRFWGEVDVFNTETRKRSKVNDVIGVLLQSEEAPPQNSSTPALPAADISQTPGDSQSGGAQAPAESEGTLSAEDPETVRQGDGESQSPDFAADLAANGASQPEADDVGAGQEQQAAVNDEPPAAAAPPTPTPPVQPKPVKPKPPANKTVSKAKK